MARGAILTQMRPERLKDVLAGIQVCALDFDGCMVHGISKVWVAQSVTRAIAFRPISSQDRRYLPRLSLTGAILVACRLWQRATGRLTDADLVRLYVHLLDPIPRNYFVRAASEVPARLLPGVEAAFAWLAARWPVGVISLALTDVLTAVDRHLAARTSHCFAFMLGNQLSINRTSPPQLRVLTAADKRACLAEVLAGRGWTRPLVIGHDREDLGLVALARELGGLSLGLGPSAALAGEFDLILPSGDWHSIPHVLQGALDPVAPLPPAACPAAPHSPPGAQGG